MRFAKRGWCANSRPTNSRRSTPRARVIDGELVEPATVEDLKRLLVALSQPAYRPLLRKHLRPLLLDLFARMQPESSAFTSPWGTMQNDSRRDGCSRWARTTLHGRRNG